MPTKPTGSFNDTAKRHSHTTHLELTTTVNSLLALDIHQNVTTCTVIPNEAKIPLGCSRLDTTRHDTFDMSNACILVVSSLSNSRTRHTPHDERERRDSQLSLSCNFYKVMIFKLFTDLLEYTFIDLFYFM